MTDDELDALLAKQTEEIRRAPLAAHRQAYVDATKALRAERDYLKAQNERLRDDEETFAARQYAYDRDLHERHNADIGRLASHYEARLDAQAVELESARSEAERLRVMVDSPPKPLKTLNPDEWSDLRVRSIIEHLHHRQWGQWGDPLDSCIKAMTKVIDANEPTEP